LPGLGGQLASDTPGAWPVERTRAPTAKCHPEEGPQQDQQFGKQELSTSNTEIGKSIQIALMNLKSFWERHRAQRWTVTAALSAKARIPKPFQPLTRDESIAILDDAIQWLIDEARATLLMSDGPLKKRREAELRARDKSMARDFQRLIRQQEG